MDSATDRILSLEEIRVALKNRRLYLLSKECGICYPTLKDLADGHTTSNIRLGTLKKISKYIIENYLQDIQNHASAFENPMLHSCGDKGELRFNSIYSELKIYFCKECAEYFGTEKAMKLASNMIAGLQAGKK